MRFLLLTFLLPLPLAAQDEKQSFEIPEFGVRLPYSSTDFSLRTEKFLWDWAGAICEIESKDGKIQGAILLQLFSGGVSALPYAARWEREVLSKRKEIVGQRRTKDQPVGERMGDWMFREYVANEEEGHARRLMCLFGARGNKNVVFVLSVDAAQWEACRPRMYAIALSLEFRKVWLCQKCTALVRPEMKSCPGCTTPVYPDNADLEAFSRTYEIQFAPHPSQEFLTTIFNDKNISVLEASDAALERYFIILAGELAKYPSEFFRRLDWDRVIFGKELISYGKSAGGFCHGLAGTIAYVPYENLDPERKRQKDVHHELLHAIDGKEDGELNDDPRWKEMNRWGFEYWNRNMPKGGTDFFSAYNKGIISDYCRNELADDKAEIFGHLVIRQQKMIEKAKDDTTLARKIAVIKKMVCDYCPKMDDAWWSSLAK